MTTSTLLNTDANALSYVSSAGRFMWLQSVASEGNTECGGVNLTRSWRSKTREARRQAAPDCRREVWGGGGRGALGKFRNHMFKNVYYWTLVYCFCHSSCDCRCSKWPVTTASSRCRYWQGNGLAIHRSRVLVLAGHHCVVALVKLLIHLSASVTKQYIIWYRPREADLFGWKINHGPGGN